MKIKLFLQNVKHIFVPAERKIPKVRIETRQAELLYKKRIIVAIDSWPRNSRYPQGHFVRALGDIGDKTTENEVLLLEHDVPHSRFSDAVLSFLPKLPWTITELVSNNLIIIIYLLNNPILILFPREFVSILNIQFKKKHDNNKLF